MLLARELYNLLLEKAKMHYKETGKTFNRNNMNKWITELKSQRSDLEGVYSQVLQNVADRVSKAYRNFFARVKARKAGRNVKAGFPRAKKFVSSITYPQSGFEFIQQKKVLQVSKIGHIPVVLDRKIDGRTKTLTIKKSKSGEWYASTIVPSPDVPFVPNNGNVIGMDLGINSLAALSDGTKIENLRVYEKKLRRIARLHRRVSMRKNNGRNRRKAVMRLAKASEHVERKRTDYLHKQSRIMVNSYSIIACEKLNIENMLKSHRLARSISDASWGNFVRMICYKAESAGCRVIEVDPRNTSRTCSCCGNIREISLSERTYDCGRCGMIMDRDVNAARNILKRATAGPAGSYASGDTANTAQRCAASGIDEPGTTYGRIAVGNPRL